MAGKIVTDQHVYPFEFELVDSDSDQVKTVISSTKQISSRLDPSTIKLRHRIGRGPFGDVWLATHHQKTEDYEEYHEIAVKMLHPVKEDSVKIVLDKLDELFAECQGLKGVCWLQGITVISGKICIVMKFYEGSIGDKLSRFKGGKLLLHNILRYGIDLAQAIMELQSRNILVLNLKPSNILLDENDAVVVGDLGIPFVLLGIPLPNSDMVRRLGTPHYMAPEQWQPEVRGPLSFETDSWGFACTILEMLTGRQPWCGKSVDEIYNLVVLKQEKPQLPSGLPPAIENVITGCFEYDLRSRPVMMDIINAFKSSLDVFNRDGSWAGLISKPIVEKLSVSGYTQWFLAKDSLQVGDMVRSRKQLNSCKTENMEIPEGTIVGLERDPNQNGFVLVRVHGIHDPVRVHGLSLERVTHGLAAGDWVHLKEEDKKHSPVGILHSIHRNGSVAVGFIGKETLWKGDSSELQMAESFCLGQFVRLKPSVFSPRFDWPKKRGGEWATGRVCRILPNACLVVSFPGRLGFRDRSNGFLADPAEVEAVSFSTCPDIIKKYQHLEDFHWAVRPLLIAFGLFTAMKLGFFVGTKMSMSNVMKQDKENGGMQCEGQSGSNGGWIPPKVANIIFREGVGSAATPR